MVGRTKCYRKAAILADELRDRMHKEFGLDGNVTTSEASLLMLADEVRAHAELVESRVMLAQRVLSGGTVDRGIVAAARDFLGFCLRLVRTTKENAPDCGRSEANVELAA